MSDNPAIRQEGYVQVLGPVVRLPSVCVAPRGRHRKQSVLRERHPE